MAVNKSKLVWTHSTISNLSGQVLPLRLLLINRVSETIFILEPLLKIVVSDLFLTSGPEYEDWADEASEKPEEESGSYFLDMVTLIHTTSSELSCLLWVIVRIALCKEPTWQHNLPMFVKIHYSRCDAANINHQPPLLLPRNPHFLPTLWCHY